MLSCSSWKESNFSALVPVLPKWLLAPCVVSYKYLPINDSLTWRYLYIFLCFQGIWDILGRVEITWYSPGGKLELNLAFRCLKKALLIRWPTVIFEWRKERSAIISLSFQLSLCLRFLKHHHYALCAYGDFCYSNAYCICRCDGGAEKSEKKM